MRLPLVRYIYIYFRYCSNKYNQLKWFKVSDSWMQCVCVFWGAGVMFKSGGVEEEASVKCL